MISPLKLKIKLNEQRQWDTSKGNYNQTFRIPIHHSKGHSDYSLFHSSFLQRWIEEDEMGVGKAYFREDHPFKSESLFKKVTNIIVECDVLLQIVFKVNQRQRLE